MGWTGKIVGSLLGLLLSKGSLLGGLLGLLLGHQFDRGLGQTAAGESLQDAFRGRSGRNRQQLFFESTFLVMGHLAKADGRVSEEEVQTARSIMHRMHLTPEQVRLAIDLFTRGKQPDFNIDRQMLAFRQACARQTLLLNAFLEIQLELALSKEHISKNERDLLWRIAEHLGASRADLAQLEAILRARRSFGAGRTAGAQESELDKAYEALGIETSATDREVKTAYRRLMNQHHPDKLVAKGLPDSMMEMAKEQTREIRAAYEVIKGHRGIK
ncbi:MAG: co-chaperone DjlA [Gammaproteobacteria bacterium]